jgi:phosphatidylserine/phosphatidylglycerophosphate/cardiolipin synthase-like enzyme
MSDVWFSPNQVFGEQIAAKIVAALHQAQSEILHWTYSFTNADIKTAITDAIGAGVNYKGAWDEGSTTKTQAQFHDDIVQAGQTGPGTAAINLVKGFGQYGIMHLKGFAIDRATVYAGSYNWTLNAEDNNFEEVNVIVDPALVAKYLANFPVVFNAGNPEATGVRRPVVRLTRQMRTIRRPRF